MISCDFSPESRFYLQCTDLPLLLENAVLRICIERRDPDTDLPLSPSLPFVLEQVDLLTSAGCDVIVFLDGGKDWSVDPASTEELHGIDVIVQVRPP